MGTSARGPKSNQAQRQFAPQERTFEDVPQADVSMGILVGTAASNPHPLGEISQRSSANAKSLTTLDISGPRKSRLSQHSRPTLDHNITDLDQASGTWPRACEGAWRLKT